MVRLYSRQAKVCFILFCHQIVCRPWLITNGPFLSLTHRLSSLSVSSAIIEASAYKLLVYDQLNRTTAVLISSLGASSTIILSRAR